MTTESQKTTTSTTFSQRGRPDQTATITRWEGPLKRGTVGGTTQEKAPTKALPIMRQHM